MGHNRLFSTASRTLIVGCTRSPMGSYIGQLQHFPTIYLGGHVIYNLLAISDYDPHLIEECIIGIGNAAACAQNPARQLILGGQFGFGTICTSISNGVLSSGKAIILSIQAIQSGEREIILSGGLDSYSSMPHYLNLRSDRGNYASLCIDAFTDTLYSIETQNNFSTNIEEEVAIEELEKYAWNSRSKAWKAQQNGALKWEISGVSIPISPKTILSSDYFVPVYEEDKNLNNVTEKITILEDELIPMERNGEDERSVYSLMGDGACALLLASPTSKSGKIHEAIGQIIGHKETEGCLEGVQELLREGDLNIEQIDAFEIHESSALYAIHAIRVLGINEEKVNLHGGALAYNDPSGMSAAKCIISLLNVLREGNARYGIASITDISSSNSNISILINHIENTISFLIESFL